MDSGLTRADLDKIRQHPITPEVREAAARQLEEMRVAGKLHQFSPEKRCRVCRDANIRNTVNKLLAHTASYRDIVNTLAPINESLPKNQRITKNSIYNHARRHFPNDDVAYAVWQNILKEEGTRTGQDWIDGVGAQVNVFAVLKTVMAKGTAQLQDPMTRVTTSETMAAAVKYHELIKEETDAAQIAELYNKLNMIIAAVKDVVTPSDYSKIVSRLESLEQGIIEADVEDIELDEDDYDEEPEEAIKE